MNTERLLIRLLLILSLVITGVSFTSCSDDDTTEQNENDVPPQNDEPQPDVPINKAGEDFYMFVNKNWHNSLTNADPDEIYGYFNDADQVSEEKVDAIKSQMKEYELLSKAIANNANNQAASNELIEQITEELLGNIETKNDAYIAFGKAIRMGFATIGEIHTGICTEDFSLGYLISLEGDEDDEEAKYINHRAPDVISSKKYNRYAAITRSENSVESYIVEGLGIDPKYYLQNPDNNELFEAMEQMPLEALIEIIAQSIQTNMYMYCDDKTVKEMTGGIFTNVQDFVSATIEDDMGYFTSYYYTQEYIDEGVRNTFKEYGEELKATFRQRIENNSWLSASTKQSALEKLDYMKLYYGAPEQWLSIESPNVQGELLLADILEIKQSRIEIIEALMGKNAYDYMLLHYMFWDGELNIFPYINNAYYDTDSNSCYIMAPFLMEPLYNNDITDVDFFTAVGTTIGHEMTHGFDKEGATFDKYGQPNNWWTSDDFTKFGELNNALANHISKFEILPGVKANGQNTVMEDVADLGGFNIGYDLWIANLEAQGITGEQLKEQKQKYFISYAKVHRALYPNEYIMKNLVEDVHSINHIRVNGIVQHIDDWYELFDITKDNALYLAPEERVTIW